MIVNHYDSVAEKASILLDLPFREATGVVTIDVAPNNVPVVMVNTPTWTTLASGLQVITLNGTTEYLYLDNADSADMDFTTGDYSVGGWFNWTIDESSQIVIARYVVSNNGWEVYLTNAAGINYLTLRHHHAAGATTRTGGYSVGWTPGTTFHFGITREGDSCQFYRNGRPISTVTDALIDPETCNQDMVIGVRYSKDANYFKGQLWRPRVWSRALTKDDWRRMYDREAAWFA